MHMDLADLTTLKPFVDAFEAKFSRLDILLNNAGVMAVADKKLSKQGYEMQLATNHIGHFALTSLLLDILSKLPFSVPLKVQTRAGSAPCRSLCIVWPAVWQTLAGHALL